MTGEYRLVFEGGAFTGYGSTYQAKPGDMPKPVKKFTITTRRPYRMRLKPNATHIVTNEDYTMLFVYQTTERNYWTFVIPMTDIVSTVQEF